MTLLILFGIGLCGVVLSAGAFLVGDSDGILARFLDHATRMAKFMVGCLLLLLCLHATLDLSDLSETVLDTVVENTESFASRSNFFSNSG
jgi:hypothetical protein